MKKIAIFIMGLCTLGLQFSPAFAASAGRFSDALQDSTTSVAQNIDHSYNGVQGGSEGVRDFLIDVVKKVITPVIIIIGTLLGILGAYELLTSTSEADQKKGFSYILWGVLGIIVMVSANFLATTLVNGGIFVYDSSGGFLGTVTAQRLYSRLIFPFIKFSMYLVLGGLFLMALVRTIGMVMSGKEDTRKKALTIIQWNAFGILVIIFAKNLIETIYGTEAQVTSNTATTLGQVGTGILADKQIPYVYTIINYAIGLIGFVILIMILLQAFQLLTNPTDDGVQKKMRKNVIYIVIGLLIIGTAYVVTNFLIVK